MATITYVDLHDLLHITVADISAINAEKIIDLAVDCLNLYGADLPNMTGTAGAKSLSLESKEKGAVFMVVRAVYYGFYKGLDVVGISSLSASSPDVMSNSTIAAVIKDAGHLLSEVDVDVG